MSSMKLRSSVPNPLEHSSYYDPIRDCNVSSNGWCCLSHAVIMSNYLKPNPDSVNGDDSFLFSDDDDDGDMAHQQSLEEGRIKYAAEVAADRIQDAIDDAAQIALEISMARNRVFMAKLDLEKKVNYAAVLDRQANRLLEIANRTAAETEAFDRKVIQNNLVNDAFMESFFGVGWLDESY
jgi:hypothetical protein